MPKERAAARNCAIYAIHFTIFYQYHTVLDLCMLLCFSADHTWVLGGQHLVTAMRTIAGEYQKAGKTVPQWAREVWGDVLKVDTPLLTKKLISGDHNAIQHATSALLLSNVLEHYHERISETGETGQDMLMEAIRIAGKMPTSKNWTPVCPIVLYYLFSLLSE